MIRYWFGDIMIWYDGMNYYFIQWYYMNMNDMTIWHDIISYNFMIYNLYIQMQFISFVVKTWYDEMIWYDKWHDMIWYIIILFL